MAEAIAYFATAGYVTLGSGMVILQIGKPRDPISNGLALYTTILCLVLIALLVAAGLGLL